MLKLSKILLAWAWAFFILAVLSAPMPVFPESEEVFTWYDKFIHLALFFFFVYFLNQAFLAYGWSKKNIIYISSVFGFLLALFCEYIQAFVPGRSLDEADFISGLLGVFLAQINFLINSKAPKSKLLLHICCIGCGAHVGRVLAQKYQVSLFFYNPSIYPKKEYDKRLKESEKIAQKFSWPFFKGFYTHKKWLKMVEGRESEKERGQRCFLCYEDRLKKTAQFAKKNGFAYFASTLSLSPHKDYQQLKKIGQKIEEETGVKFHDEDFKKQDGFKKASLLSKELGLYRQNYCGCEFSQRKN